MAEDLVLQVRWIAPDLKGDRPDAAQAPSGPSRARRFTHGG
jgi:hypothetical protein